MSYHVTSPLLRAGNQATPMPLDILAIQHIYGPNLNYHTGDDTYVLADDGVVRTIWDAGGTDTIDASNLSRGLTLDLHEASFIRTGTHSVTALAYDVTENGVIVNAIENAIGTNFADRILGNTADNSLSGGGGNDVIAGDSGHDTLDGGLGADRMTGGSGDDTFIADNKGDVASKSANGGHNVVMSSVSFTLGSNVEDLVLKTGASAALISTGNDLANLLQGNEFNDTFDGKAAADTMRGGEGDQRLSRRQPGRHRRGKCGEAGRDPNVAGNAHGGGKRRELHVHREGSRRFRRKYARQRHHGHGEERYAQWRRRRRYARWPSGCRQPDGRRRQRHLRHRQRDG